MGIVIGAMTVVTAVVAAGVPLRGEDETGTGKPPGAEDERSALADRCRHVPGRHDDTQGKAEQYQPDQPVSCIFPGDAYHGVADTSDGARLYLNGSH
jgi:hypothetical protein